MLEGPNQLAGYLEVALATLGALAIARRRAIVDVALAIATCADVLTFSRAGLFGLLLVGAVLVAVARRDALRALRPAFAGFVAGLFGVAGGSRMLIARTFCGFRSAGRSTPAASVTAASYIAPRCACSYVIR